MLAESLLDGKKNFSISVFFLWEGWNENEFRFIILDAVNTK